MPGDVIFTGTPGKTQQVLKGDVIEVEIEGNRHIAQCHRPLKSGTIDPRSNAAYSQIATMSEESVRAFFAENAPDIQIEKLDRSSETSWLSAAWNIKPAQIAKTLSLRVGERSVMLVTCGELATG